MQFPNQTRNLSFGINKFWNPASLEVDSFEASRGELPKISATVHLPKDSGSGPPAGDISEAMEVNDTPNTSTAARMIHLPDIAKMRLVEYLFEYATEEAGTSIFNGRRCYTADFMTRCKSAGSSPPYPYRTHLNVRAVLIGHQTTKKEHLRES